MKTRLISALILLPIGIAVILIGGGLFDLAMAFIFTLAVYEFVQLMKTGKFAPNLVFAVAFVWVLLLDAVPPPLNLARPPPIGLWPSQADSIWVWRARTLS
jgi:CDP-diglyceride synthetase